jgi:hypothetical protein
MPFGLQGQFQLGRHARSVSDGGAG